MALCAHAYSGESDLYKIQSAVAGWIASAGFRGYLNVSDIALRLFNGMRKYDPAEIVRLWEDAEGHLVGWSMVYPPWKSYEALLHPGYRGHLLEAEMLEWAEGELVRHLQRNGQERRVIQLDVFEGDSMRMSLLEQYGYARGEQRGMISTRSLDEPIPEPQLLEGFTIRSLRGEADAEALVALVNDSFGLSWTVEGYQQVLRSPGYRPENELVVTAPDGRLAASCILLPDERNRTGMFENVGTHSAFRRLGLAQALLYAGMEQWKVQGFRLAMVPHDSTLSAAAALYTSAGFQPIYKILHYRKVLPA